MLGGYYYSSQSQAAKAIGAFQSAIAQSINGGYRVNGWKAEYCWDDIRTSDINRYYGINPSKKITKSS